MKTSDIKEKYGGEEQRHFKTKSSPLISREIKLVGDTFRPKRVHTKRKESSIVNATREESWLPLCHVEFMGGGQQQQLGQSAGVN